MECKVAFRNTNTGRVSRAGKKTKQFLGIIYSKKHLTQLCNKLYWANQLISNHSQNLNIHIHQIMLEHGNI